MIGSHFGRKLKKRHAQNIFSVYAQRLAWPGYAVAAQMRWPPICPLKRGHQLTLHNLTPGLELLHIPPRGFNDPLVTIVLDCLSLLFLFPNWAVPAETANGNEPPHFSVIKPGRERSKDVTFLKLIRSCSPEVRGQRFPPFCSALKMEIMVISMALSRGQRWS